MRRDPPPLADSPARPSPDSFEASLLRAIFRRALGAALASSLGAVGCATDEQDACKAYKPLELSALEPASPIDHVSLRVSYPGDSAPHERASAGVPCSAATDMPACSVALERTPDGLEPLDSCGMRGQCRNFLATTAGDEVKRYATREELLAFLGPIDSPDDALLLLAYDDKYEVDRPTCSPRRHAR